MDSSQFRLGQRLELAEREMGAMRKVPALQNSTYL